MRFAITSRNLFLFIVFFLCAGARRVIGVSVYRYTASETEPVYK